VLSQAEQTNHYYPDENTTKNHFSRKNPGMTFSHTDPNTLMSLPHKTCGPGTLLASENPENSGHTHTLLAALKRSAVY